MIAGLCSPQRDQARRCCTGTGEGSQSPAGLTWHCRKLGLSESAQRRALMLVSVLWHHASCGLPIRAGCKCHTAHLTCLTLWPFSLVWDLTPGSANRGPSAGPISLRRAMVSTKKSRVREDTWKGHGLQGAHGTHALCGTSLCADITPLRSQLSICYQQASGASTRASMHTLLHTGKCMKHGKPVPA